MRILAIETSCDETALAILDCAGDISRPRFRIIKHAIASQIALHREFGGVVPNIAKREHIKHLPLLLKKIDPSGRLVSAVDAIAVTVGPGLEPALWAGITFALDLSTRLKKPIIGANHLEGHLFSFLLPQKGKPPLKTIHRLFPMVALLVSGGHTIILAASDLAHWKKLGETRDDAVGEAYDKVARMLELPYPGGPEIQKLAVRGNADAIAFPRPMINEKSYDFSYSGLKTAVLYHLRDAKPASNSADVAASFQKAAVDVLLKKTARAVAEYGAKSVTISGGVAANTYLRRAMRSYCRTSGLDFFVPDFKHNTDNAAMIGAAAYINTLRGKQYPLRANGALNF